MSRGEDRNGRAKLTDENSLWAVLIRELEWPSLTVQWVPDQPGSISKGVHKFLYGTRTRDNEPNYLMLAEVQTPLDASDKNGGQKGDTVRCIRLVNHEGDVNRARCMPQKPSLIATKNSSAEVYVFDSSTQLYKPLRRGGCNPALRLRGHKSEGTGLSWSPVREGLLLSGSDDARICVWDINAGPKSKRTIDAKHIYQGHTGVVEDVSWHSSHVCLFGSVGDDRQLLLWDTRKSTNEKPVPAIQAHQAAVNCLAFNPSNAWLLATGSADRTVALYDMRNLSKCLHVLVYHKEEVYQIGWNPVDRTVLASCGADKKLLLWDLDAIGKEASPDDAVQGLPELLLAHGGHESTIYDFSWNPNEEYLIASVADDNILQLWQVACGQKNPPSLRRIHHR